MNRVHLEGQGPRRARQAGQKLERRQAILDAAWQLFQATSYDAVTIADVAGALGLAKGTLYLYFPTKEALFLALQEQQLAAWFDDVDARLQTGLGAATAAEVADVITRSLAARGGLTRLLAILSTNLEHNIDLETARRFKQFLGQHLTRTGGLLEQRLPGLRPGQGAQWLLRLQALIVGLRHLADPAPVVQQVLREPGLQMFVVDFEAELAESIKALLGAAERDPRRSKWATG